MGVPTERAGTLRRGGAPSRAGRALGHQSQVCRVRPGVASAHTHLPTSPVPLLCVSSGSRPPAPATPIYGPLGRCVGGPGGVRPCGRDRVSHERSSPRPLSSLQISPGAQRTKLPRPWENGQLLYVCCTRSPGPPGSPSEPSASLICVLLRGSPGGPRQPSVRALAQTRAYTPFSEPRGVSLPLPTCVAGPLRRDGLSTKTGEWLMPCLGSLFLQLWPQTPGVTWGKSHQ